MANDNNLDILIRIVTQTVGPEKAPEVIKKLREEVAKTTVATKEAGKVAFETGKRTEEVTQKNVIKTAEWKRSLALLGSQFGVFGQVARFALNPIVGVVAGATIAIGVFRKAIEESNTALDDLHSSKAVSAIEEIKEAFLDAEKAAAAFNREFERAGTPDSPAGEEAKRKQEEARAADAAEDDLRRARQTSEMARAQTPEARAEVKAKFTAEERAAADKRFARDQKMAAEAAKAMDEEAKTKEAEAKSADEQFKAAVRANMQKKKQLEAEREEKKKLDAFIDAAEENEGFVGPAGTWIGTDSGFFQGMKQRQAAMAATMPVLAAQIQEADVFTIPSLASDLARARGTATASKTATAEITRAAQTAADIRNQTGAARSATAATEAGNVDAAGLFTAAGAADIISAGGKVTSDQAAAVAAATKALGLTGQSSETILRILGALNDKQEHFDAALKQIEQHLAGSRNR